MAGVSKNASKRAKREAESAALDKAALDFWFKFSDTSMTDLEEAIDRWGADDHIGIGVHPEVLSSLMDRASELGRDRVVLICRAMQNIYMRRVAARIAAEGRSL